jgi:hypothetical protein
VHWAELAGRSYRERGLRSAILRRGPLLGEGYASYVAGGVDRAGEIAGRNWVVSQTVVSHTLLIGVGRGDDCHDYVTAGMPGVKVPRRARHHQELNTSSHRSLPSSSRRSASSILRSR